MILRDQTNKHVLNWTGFTPGTFGGFLDVQATSYFNEHFAVSVLLLGEWQLCQAYGKVDQCQQQATHNVSDPRADTTELNSHIGLEVCHDWKQLSRSSAHDVTL